MGHLDHLTLHLDLNTHSMNCFHLNPLHLHVQGVGVMAAQYVLEHIVEITCWPCMYV